MEYINQVAKKWSTVIHKKIQFKITDYESYMKRWYKQIPNTIVGHTTILEIWLPSEDENLSDKNQLLW